MVILNKLVVVVVVVIWWRSPEWPKATSFLGVSGGMLPRKFFENEYALRRNLVHFERHNFEKCYNVCTDLVATG